MSSGSTGYDTKTYEHIKYLYDTQAWLPKNAVIVNRAAFDALDKATQDAVLKAAPTPRRAAGSCRRKRTGGTSISCKKNGMKILPPSPQLAADMKKVGDTMLEEWLKKAGADGQAVVDAYKKLDLTRAACRRALLPDARCCRPREGGDPAAYVGRHRFPPEPALECVVGAGNDRGLVAIVTYLENTKSESNSTRCTTAAYAAAVFMVGMLCVVLVGILDRYLAWRLRGTDMYAGYMMAASGFLALAHTLKRGEHIRVTLILQQLARQRPASAGGLGARCGDAAGGAVRAATACGWPGSPRHFTTFRTGNDATPLWIPQLAMAVGTVVLLVAFVDELVLEIARPARIDARSPRDEALRNE